MINPLQTPPITLVESVYHKLKRDISSSYLKPNEKINIKLLSERYQASETPIKQALNRLVSEGLVVSIPRRGMKVKRISREEIDELFEIRLMLDTFFAKKVIDNLADNPRLCGQLQDNIREHIHHIEQASGSSGYDTIYFLDSQFHELYLTGSGNKKAVEIYQNLNSHVYSTYLYARQSKEKTLNGAYEHQIILDALLAGDEPRAVQCLSLHISNAREAIYPMLKQDEAISGNKLYD